MALGKPAAKGDPQNFTVNELSVSYSQESPQLRTGDTTPGNIDAASLRLTAKAMFIKPTPMALG